MTDQHFNNGKDWDEVVDSFEQHWRANGIADLEEFVAQAREGEFSKCLRALIETELERRHEVNDSPSTDDYVSRFPDHPKEIEQAFAAFARRCINSGSEQKDHPAKLADRNLLFGIHAWQAGLITENQLLAAMQAWVFRKFDQIGDILVEQGALRYNQKDALDSMVNACLRLHAENASDALSRMSSKPEIAKKLKKDISDSELQGSIGRIARASTEGLEETYVPPNSESARFTIIRHHDNGALGNVFLARDEQLSREVALKEIQLHHADDPTSRSRFLLEAEVTGGLEHPGIVPVYGMGQYADGRPYYAMRFIQGNNLKTEIQRFHDTAWSAQERRMELRKLLGRFIDVCHAVGYAHSRGVLHRDLKPGNIMIGKYGETLVVDWGLARVHGRSKEQKQVSDDATIRPQSGSQGTEQGVRMGTPQFMSPEQCAGDLETLSPRSDIYSLGVTLYQLLTGRVPFSRDNIQSQIRLGEFESPRAIDETIPIHLESTCLRAMALRPEDRFATLEEFIADLEQWLADEPVQHALEKVSHFESEVRSHPKVVEYSERLSRELCTLSSILASLQRLDEALSAVRRASQLMDGLETRSDRERIRVRHEYLYARQCEIGLLEQQGDSEAASRLKEEVENEIQTLFSRFSGDKLQDDVISMTLHFGLPSLAEIDVGESADESQSETDNATDWNLRELSPKEREELRNNLQAFDATHHPFEDSASFEPDSTVHPAETDRTPSKDAFRFADKDKRYEIRYQIGRGGVSNVYRAFDTALSRHVALKVANANHDHIDDVFTAEIKLLSQLIHPNIPQVFSAGRTNGGELYYTMPIFDEDSLADRVRSQPDEKHLRTMIGVLLDVCDAVQYAHDYGVINLDIKPHNVLFSENRPFLVDWGLATFRENSLTNPEPLKWQPRMEASQQVVGTSWFMSPEQARGETEQLGVQSDIFLLGGLLHHVMTGRSPRSETIAKVSPGEAFRRIAKEPISFKMLNRRKGLPIRLKQICQKALSFEPEDRFACVGDMQGEIGDWLHGTGTDGT